MLLAWILCLQRGILTLDFESSLKLVKFCDANFVSEIYPEFCSRYIKEQGL